MGGDSPNTTPFSESPLERPERQCGELDKSLHDRQSLEWIGRYRVETILGQGGFGTTYLAYDGQLQRRVAIKIPHPDLVSLPQEAAAYLDEARMAASLDHPNIVPVFDVGSTEQCPCFIVSK